VEVVVAPGFIRRQSGERAAEVPGGAGRPVAAVFVANFIRMLPAASVGSALLP